MYCLYWRACSKPKGSEYFPSPRVGSRSEFAVELGGLLGVQHASTVSRVDEETTIQGRNYFKSISTFSGIPGVDQQTSYSRVAPEGVYILDGDDLAKPKYLDTPFFPWELATHGNQSDGPHNLTTQLSALRPLIPRREHSKTACDSLSRGTAGQD